MLYAAIDMEHKKVHDIILGGEAAHLFQELIDLYNRMTGENRKSFASLDEAKRMCVEAVQRRYFPEGVVTTPAQPPVDAQPVEKATQAVQQVAGSPTPPWARAETKNGTNPNPPPQKAPAAPVPAPTQVAATPPAREMQAQGPVARARMVFDQMKGAPRKDVIDACVALGIKRSTAQTQYQGWKKAQEEHGTEFRNPSTGAPQLAPGSYVGQPH